jgi:hypothetical protein
VNISTIVYKVEVCDLNTSPFIVRLVNSGRLGWDRREGMCINFSSGKIFKSSAWDFERKKGLSLYRVKICLTEMGCECRK